VREFFRESIFRVRILLGYNGTCDSDFRFCQKGELFIVSMDIYHGMLCPIVSSNATLVSSSDSYI